jgi:hypothetical protein
MITLEALADNSISDRNFQKLRSLVLDTGGITAGIRIGTDAVTFTASTTSATKTVTHGLGKIPTFVGLQAVDSSGAITVRPVAGASNNTTFDAIGRCASAVTGAATFYWVVIG